VLNDLTFAQSSTLKLLKRLNQNSETAFDLYLKSIRTKTEVHKLSNSFCGLFDFSWSVLASTLDQSRVA